MSQRDFDTRGFLNVILFGMIIFLGWSYYQQWQAKKNAPSPVTPAATAPAASTPASAPATATTQPAGSLTANTAHVWHLVPVANAENTLLGSRVKDSGYKAEILLDGKTAAIRQTLLSEYKFRIEDKETGYPLLLPARNESQKREQLTLMLGTLKFKGRPEIFSLADAVWQKTGSQTDDKGTIAVTYTAVIADEQNQPVVEIIRTYRYQMNNYELACDLALVNRTEAPLQVESLEFFGPSGTLREDPRTDDRHALAGFADASQKYTTVAAQLAMLKDASEKGFMKRPDNMGLTLRWFGIANKYFAAAVRPLASEAKTAFNYIPNGGLTASILTNMYQTDQRVSPEVLGLQTTLTVDGVIEPQSRQTINQQLYLGPIDNDIFVQPQYANLHYEKLVPNSSCSFCAFDWLTLFIVKVLNTMYAFLGNYGVAIIILVLVVRLILHPLTKKGQVSMMKMQKLQPKMEEIKKKYANDKQELQKRTMELQKEMGPSMMLGCLPMFLQMPIWIALYTAVNVNVAVRHKGLFPASWHWLTDLSAPDRLIPFSWFGVTEPVDIPLIGSVIGSIDAFNLLPILLGVAMFLQQKLTPQSTTSTNPQVAQQQKMMLWMMPIMMLVFLYSGPSGLNLYIMASTFGGVIEQYYIRKHIREREALEAETAVTGTSKIADRMGIKKKKPKPPIRYS